jgi:uncharacterized oxidoreductase
MEVKGNTILITGGATGIGFALAEALSKLGNNVIICGRREDKLKEAQQKLPGIHIKVCDISKPVDQKMLYEWIKSEFKDLNILINNAGIQRRIDLKKGIDGLLNVEEEIDTNFKAQVYLSAYFIPMLSTQKESAIVNVSSGLGFAPIAMFPIYCATKAAIHSYSMSLRYQLRETPIKVFEIVPPIVYDTYLKGKMLEKTEWSSSSIEVAEAFVNALENNEYEVPIGATKNLVKSSREELDGAFKRMNQ